MTERLGDQNIQPLIVALNKSVQAFQLFYQKALQLEPNFTTKLLELENIYII